MSKMGEHYLEQCGREPTPRPFTDKEREMLRADPAFAEWLDQLEKESIQHEREHQRPDL